MNNIANLTAARDHYAAHGFDIIKYTLYTSKDTWKETYESAPLERGAISALSNVNGSICAKFPGIDLSPLEREVIVASSNAHGSIPAKFPSFKTQPPTLHVPPTGASDTESPANNM